MEALLHIMGKYRIRTADEWHPHFYGFNMKPGFLFGTAPIDGEQSDWVYTGCIKHAKRPDGTVYGKKVKVYCRSHVSAFCADQTTHDYEWAPQWISCGSGLGKKILEAKTNIVPDYKPTEPSPGRHLFKTSKRQLG